MEKETLFYIRTKTSSAKAQLQALSDSGDIEILPVDLIPEWQQKETLQRIVYMKQHPETVISLAEFQQMLLKEDED